MVTPTLTLMGRHPKGADPKNPRSRFLFSFGSPYTTMLHGVSPDEAASARGPIAVPFKISGTVFMRALFAIALRHPVHPDPAIARASMVVIPDMRLFEIVRKIRKMHCPFLI
jgi:hypothetical protein